MTTLPNPDRIQLRAVALILALAAVSAARAQFTPIELAPVVTTADRVPEPSQTVGANVEVIPAAQVEREQLSTLAEALTGAPGVPQFATGQPGAATSVFMRGANSNQTLFLVDGIRLNDANTDYANFISGFRTSPFDRIEVTHGPQSTLYGSEAVGGVIALQSQKGAGDLAGNLWAEGGSFGTIDGGVSAQGASTSLAFNVAAAGGVTENARPNNEFDSGSVSLRLDHPLLPDLSIGATLRGYVALYGDPGNEYTNSLLNHERENNWLGTVFADGRLSENFTTHLIVGGQDRRYDAVEPPATTVVENKRDVIDWQLTGTMTETNKLTAGVTAEDETTVNTGYGDIDRRQTLLAAFAEDEFKPLKDVYLTGGLRYDDYNTFGDALTGRVTLAALNDSHVMKLRGSYGTSFNAPSFLDLYGIAPGYAGNPKLKPEKSDGWDLGADFYIPGNQGSLGVTLFRTDFRNLIEYNFGVFPGTTVNLNQARTEGIELAAKFLLINLIDTRLSYTYLRAEDDTDQIPLLRRPRNSVTADLWKDLGGGFSVGAGATYVSKRPDVDALSFATVDDPSYTVVRAYAAWKMNSHLTWKIRAENLLDEKYAPVNGYPQPGAAFYGGAEWRF